MVSISAVIITFNEERNIGRCLDSIKDVVDEIVVVDSFSTDKTQEICSQYHVRFVQNKWPGYSAQKNFGDQLASNNYILSIDADECLSLELANSIKQLKLSRSFGLYSFKRLTNYAGKWIRHGGWYPDIKTRLYDKRESHWEGTIHETLIVPQGKKPELLKGDCLHYSYYSIDEHRQKVEYFTDLMAKDAIKKNSNAGSLQLLFSPLFKFIRDYILRLGFLDGYYGLAIARISSYATFLKYKKIRQLKK